MKTIGFTLIELLLVVVIMLTLVSCASMNATQLIQYDVQNAAFTRATARQIGSTWALNSGFLTPALQDLKGFIACNCEQDLKTLDTIAAKCQKRDANGLLTCEELNDNDCGKIVYYWGKTWGAIVKSGTDKILQTFFPSVLAKILPYVTALGL
jgi:prepilin-type N-terminal cleavage/methylation domain-containing protein